MKISLHCMIDLFLSALKTGGAVFLAVCRGKLSEGVDFSVCIGIG